MRSLFAAELVKPLLAWLAILAALGLLAALAFIYSGLFNVAATVEDSAPLRLVLVSTREASIRSHARGIQTPNLGAAEQVERGFRVFREDCAMCHTPPGREPTKMSKGLNPQAPPLDGLVEDMTAAELFWVTKNGIRFTGMPAWQSSHDDPDVWAVVAFMRRSQGIPAGDYDKLDRSVPAIQSARKGVGQ